MCLLGGEDGFSMMNPFGGRLDRLKPAVSRRTLLLLAALLWVAVGILLLRFAVGWLRNERPAHVLWLVGIGVLAALAIHRFGFSRVVNKNLGRIMPMEGRRCLFSFLSWRSYVVVGLMATMGIALRHSPIPKPYLAVVYVGIGLALLLSGVRYVRVAWLRLRFKT